MGQHSRKGIPKLPNLALLETSGLYQAIEVGARLGTAHRARLAISYCQTTAKFRGFWGIVALFVVIFRG